MVGLATVWYIPTRLFTGEDLTSRSSAISPGKLFIAKSNLYPTPSQFSHPAFCLAHKLSLIPVNNKIFITFYENSWPLDFRDHNCF